MTGEEERNMKVAVRVRPNNKRELEVKQKTIIKVIDNTTLLFDPQEDEDEFYFQGVKQNYRDITKKVNKKLTMEFDRVFNEESTNVDVFEECTKPLIESVLNGYNCSVFVYGATGAGKTFTMLGNEIYPGLTFLTMNELFTKMDDMSETKVFEIGISYLEVYNEHVMNLLTKSGPLKLREDTNGVIVSGLILIPIKSANELITLLLQGNKNRTQHPTDANAESSRSHAIFQVHIRMTEKKTGQKRTVKLSMIDLAGSERAASTKGIGQRFKEGASINKSLLALGNCINKLADGLKHIPYRDSNLTRILKDSLGGNCQTLMIANVSPSSLTFEDTYNTLKYASRAKKIRTTVRQNTMKTNMPKEYYVKKMCEQVSEIDKLKETNKQLEIKLSNLQKVENNNGFDENEFKIWCKRIDSIYSDVIKAQENYSGLESKEKLIGFRIKLKNHIEAHKRALSVINGRKVNEDIMRLEASVDRLGKRIASQQEDMDRWKKRYIESTMELEKLRNEIKGSKLAFVLNVYLKSKDKEIENAKINLQLGHLQKIQNLSHNETENIRKLLSYGFEIIEQSYVKLRCNHLLDKDLEDMYRKAITMTNTNEIRFNDQETHSKKEIENEVDDIDVGVSELDIINESYNENNKMCNNKRKFQNSYENNDDPLNINNQEKHTTYDSDKFSKVPRIEIFSDSCNNINNNSENNEMKHNSIELNELKSNLLLSPIRCNLNETHVSEDPNSTFLIPGNITKNNRKIRTDILKNILNDTNVNAKNGAVLTKALIKSNIAGPSFLTKVSSKVATSLNKENKKFSPNRIRKSPRAAAASIVGKALNSATKNFLNNKQNRIRSNTVSPTKNIGSVGRVRLNRAASMRTKK